MTSVSSNGGYQHIGCRKGPTWVSSTTSTKSSPTSWEHGRIPLGRSANRLKICLEPRVRWVGRSRLEELVRLDNEPFTEKAELEPDQDLRPNEPELGYGCGRASSTNPAEWALIGVSNGIEEWGGAERAQTKLLGSYLATIFEPLPIAVTTDTPTKLSEREATLTGTVNPFGFPTKYVVQYGAAAVEEHTTAETTLESTGTSPVRMAATLTGLSPGQVYRYRVEAFHYEPGSERHTDISYGPEGSFSTTVAPCAGANITGQGSSLQRLAQQVARTARLQHLQRVASGSAGPKGSPKVTYGEQRAGLTSGCRRKTEGTIRQAGEGNVHRHGRTTECNADRLPR